MNNDQYDVVVVGAGLVGLATARALLLEQPHLRVAVVEKESQIAAHQSSHNSGVVHAGVYYAPGSQKARFCTAGRRLLEAYTAEHQIPLQRLGKLVVAVRDDEIGRLENLVTRATANGLQGLELLPPEGMREREPHIRGVRALWVPESGVVDFALVARAYAADVEAAGGELVLSTALRDVAQRSDGLAVTAGARVLHTRFLISCAGLQSDRVARLAGATPDVSIIPFRGDWWTLAPRAADLVRGLVYPVPDPELPFLGVHLTRRFDGAVWAGPNAILSLAREGYGWHDFNRHDTQDVLRNKGFHHLAKKWWRTGAAEMLRTASRRAYLATVRPYLPELTVSDLVERTSGIRAQAIAADGSMVDDFHLLESPRALHVLNAPSPAATASLAIGAHLAERALTRLDA
jgi:L-2-hydroxyglutarate oxidase